MTSAPFRSLLLASSLGLAPAGCGPADAPERSGPASSPSVPAPASAAPSGDTASPTPGDWVASEPVTCAAPEARQAQPIEVVEEGGWADRPPTGGAWGVLAADLDRDGWIDLVLPTAAGIKLYRNQGGLLVDASDRLPDEVQSARHRAVVAADVDDDGDLDVYLGGRDVDDYLLINDGTGGFTGRPVHHGSRTMGAAFADLDGDRDLDLVVANGTSTTDDVVFLNDGAGHFTPRPDLVPDSLPKGAAFVVAPIDLDGDTLPELYRANDAGPWGPGNRVAWNRGGTAFELDDGSAGLNLDICSMGLAIGDINGDRIPDLAVSDCRDLHLMKSTPDLGLWVNHADATGLHISPETGHDVPWGLELVDLDNDADLDLYVAYGYLPNTDWPNEREQRDGVYLQGDDGTFDEVSIAWGIGLGQSRGFAVADLDNDGWLDIVKQDWMGRPTIYRARCGTEAWVRVELDQGEGWRNRFGVGARLVVRDGDREQTRWILAGGTSVSSGGPAEAHVGLADAEHVDIEVMWPDGEVDVYTDLPTRRRLTLHRR